MMISKFRTAFADESGQGMTEYIIIVALIAIAAIGVVSLFGNNIRALFGASADALNGNTSRKVGTNGVAIHSGVEKAKNLKTFSQTNKPQGGLAGK